MNGANQFQLVGAIGFSIMLLIAVFFINLIFALLGAPQSVWLMQTLGVF